ncbi:hypothetical protein PAXRUDRAFT_171916 [Paxillus rubicundulus Ve08.2h10]|uniref:Uncharacterized protein n=1 Tax=Paxillus rubicundulus Ve08.2h10 TaxID=930991 RepID=A0A0D0CKH4_9AGAM|nr:hypothetical protein PAXRUDRAFT_171916 [Paxillus rubicundulus Ve08.2h10]
MVKRGQLCGIDVLTGTPSFCEACVLGKMKKLLFELLEEPHTTQSLQIVHMDVRDLITPQSQEGYKYWIIIIDDFCHFPWIYFMKHKNKEPIQSPRPYYTGSRW